MTPELHSKELDREGKTGESATTAPKVKDLETSFSILLFYHFLSPPEGLGLAKTRFRSVSDRLIRSLKMFFPFDCFTRIRFLGYLRHL